mgnify:CR=1 FL=1
MVKKIALEEHFLDPADRVLLAAHHGRCRAGQRRAQLYASLTDFGEQRLQMMEQARHRACRAGDRRARRAGGTRSRNQPLRAARASNDFLAKEVQKRPDRYSGFAHLPMQDAKAAADELERCVRDLEISAAP